MFLAKITGHLKISPAPIFKYPYQTWDEHVTWSKIILFLHLCTPVPKWLWTRCSGNWRNMYNIFWLINYQIPLFMNIGCTLVKFVVLQIEQTCIIWSFHSKDAIVSFILDLKHPGREPIIQHFCDDNQQWNFCHCC